MHCLGTYVEGIMLCQHLHVQKSALEDNEGLSYVPHVGLLSI